SRLATIIVLVISSNTALAAMPGNVLLPRAATGLRRDSVVNVTAVVTLHNGDLVDAVGSVPSSLLRGVDDGLRQVLPLCATSTACIVGLATVPPRGRRPTSGALLVAPDVDAPY